MKTQDLLDHLIDQYGNITAADLKSNEACINKSFDNARSIEVFFQKVDDAVQYADDGKTVYVNTNTTNCISLRQHNRHVTRDVQGMDTES